MKMTTQRELLAKVRAFFHRWFSDIFQNREASAPPGATVPLEPAIPPTPALAPAGMSREGDAPASPLSSSPGMTRPVRPLAATGGNIESRFRSRSSSPRKSAGKGALQERAETRKKDPLRRGAAPRAPVPAPSELLPIGQYIRDGVNVRCVRAIILSCIQRGGEKFVAGNYTSYKRIADPVIEGGFPADEVKRAFRWLVGQGILAVHHPNHATRKGYSVNIKLAGARSPEAREIIAAIRVALNRLHRANVVGEL